MPLSDKPTRAQIRSSVRREIMDTGTRWWTDAELNGYINACHDRVQAETGLVWGTATATLTGTTTVTLTDIASDIYRCDRVYWENRLVIPVSEETLDSFDRAWRGYGTTTHPSAWYKKNLDAVIFWPEITSTHTSTVVFEYVRQFTLSTDTATTGFPGWARYVFRPYCAFRAYARNGPNHDPHRAQRYKELFKNGVYEIKQKLRQFFPKRSLALRPATEYEISFWDLEGNLQTVSLPTNVVAGGGVNVNFEDEVPTGTINGTNTTYTLSQNPDPDDSLALYLDGLRLVQGTDYTLSGTTITMTFAPFTSQTLFSHYRYA